RPLGPAGEADIADHLGRLRVGHHRGTAVRVDVGADGALAEGVGDVRPVPVLDAGRGILVEQRDVVLERRQRLGGVDRDAIAVEPFAAVGAKDRRVDVHVLTGAAEPPEGTAPQAVVGVVDGLGVGHVFLERLGRGEALRVVDVLAIDLYRRLAVVGNAVGPAVHRGGAA